MLAIGTTLFDPARSFKDLEAQCAFGPRVPGTEAHVKCRDALIAIAKANCDKAWTQEFRHDWSQGRTGKPVTMWNIVGTQNWEKASVRIMLMAHWDSRPTADYDPVSSNRRKPILGANDGASGVAVLTELMRSFKAKAPEVGICYIFSDGEDLGPGLEEMFLGARDVVRSDTNKRLYFGDHVPNYGILLDMIGDKDLRVPMEPNSMSYAPGLMRSLYAHARLLGMSSTFPMEYGPTIEDDHICINQAGIPTIDLIDFDYEPWHTVGDTPDKCSAESLGKVGKLLESWLRQSPPWNEKIR